MRKPPSASHPTAPTCAAQDFVDLVRVLGAQRFEPPEGGVNKLGRAGHEDRIAAHDRVQLVEHRD